MKKILELATRTKEQKLHKHEGTGQSTHLELARVMTIWKPQKLAYRVASPPKHKYSPSKQSKYEIKNLQQVTSRKCTKNSKSKLKCTYDTQTTTGYPSVLENHQVLIKPA